MGTNFYFEASEGPYVAYGVLHLGKRSAGWQFRFQAYVEQGGRRRVAVNQSGLTLEIDIPPLTVKSYAEWKQILHSTRGQVYDENKTPYTVAEFEREVAALSPGKTVWPSGPPLQNHHDYLECSTGVTIGRDWNDADGFSFTVVEFS